MHSSNTLTGWRKVALAAGALAVIAAGGAAVATQAFADTGSGSGVAATAPAAAKGGAGASSATKPGHTTKKAGQQGKAASEWTPAPDCSDLRADVTYTPVPEAGEALKAALGSVAQGTISEVSGTRSSATCHHPEMVSGIAMLAPADGSARCRCRRPS